MGYDFSTIFQGLGSQAEQDYRNLLIRFIEAHIEAYKKDCRENNPLKDAAVLAVFKKCKSNNEADTLAKVSILNCLYNTQLRNYPPDDGNIKPKNRTDVVNMARHIARSKEFNDWIAEGKLDAIDYIRYIGKYSSEYKKIVYMEEYSFATKYCSFCATAIGHPDYYPIVDTYSRDVLYSLNNYLSSKGLPGVSCVKRGDMQDYVKYCELYESFRRFAASPQTNKLYSYIDLDKFLWHCGKYPGSVKGN